jgi:hypothetical protein
MEEETMCFELIWNKYEKCKYVVCVIKVKVKKKNPTGGMDVCLL